MAEALESLFLQWTVTKSNEDLDGLFTQVRNIATAMCRRDEDAVQQALIVTYTKLITFRPEDSAKFAWWVRSIVARTRRGSERDVIRRREDAFDELIDCDLHDDEFLDVSELPGAVQTVAMGLLEGKTLREIAGSQDIKPGTLRQSLKRFRDSCNES